MAERRAEIVFNAKSHNPITDAMRRELEGDFDFNSLKTKKERFYDPKVIEREMSKYDTVIVLDYGDEYHMSEEEREKKFRFYGAFSKIAKAKRKFRKIDEFMRAVRNCLDCLDIVAENNGVYDPEKFKMKVLSGKIEVFGLQFPKYIGKDRKDINWSYVADYIQDRSLDPKELISRDNSLEDLTEEELETQLFSQEQLQRFVNILQSPEDLASESYDEDDENDHRTDIVVVDDKKNLKKLTKFAPQIVTAVRDMVKAENKRRAIQNHLDNLTFTMTADDFEEIAKLDRKYEIESESDVPRFTGDIMKSKDFVKYMYDLEEYERTQIKVNYKGKMRTQEEIDEIELKDALEKAGWNLRNLYTKQAMEKKLKKARKRAEKREEELKKKLIKVQTRKDNWKKMGKKKNNEIEFDIKKKKKKKKSKEKKSDKESDG